MWVEGLAQAGLVLREALRTGFWGLQCPVHCHQPSYSLVAFALLLGFLPGVILSSCFWIWLFASSSSTPIASSPPSLVVRSAAVQARRRLEGYRQGLHEREES